MKRTGDSTIVYQVIKQGDGTFFPNVRNKESGMEYGAWKGYCKTFDEALLQLNEEIQKDKELAKNNTREVVYQYPPEPF